MPLFWIVVVHSLCCFRFVFSSAGTFSYTGLPIATVPVSGTVQTSGNSSTLFKNATKLVIDTSSSAFTALGNLYYIADSGNHVIKRVTLSTGVPVIVAGTGVAGYSSSDTVATSAKLNTPMDVSFDISGNLYIADTYNHVIRKVAYSTGIISTLLGSGTAGFTCTAIGSSCLLNTPMGIYSTSVGVLYIADSNNHVIRKLSTSGSILVSVLWGSSSGVSGTTGDNDLAASNNVLFSFPTCIIRALDLSFWICDTKSRVRRINQLGGFITTAAGSVTSGSTGDGGPGTSALLNNPMQVSCVGTSSVLSRCYIADTNNHRIRVVQNYTYAIAPSVLPTFAPTLGPTFAPVAGGTASPTTSSPVTTAGPTSLSVNIQNFAITTVAGTGTAGYSTGNGTSFFIPFYYHVHSHMHTNICMISTLSYL